MAYYKNESLTNTVGKIIIAPFKLIKNGFEIISSSNKSRNWIPLRKSRNRF